MGFLYCPNCNKGVSDLAEIPACPDCFHPFNAKIWREIYEEKQRKAEMERQRQREQSETWERNGRCGRCGGWIIRKDNTTLSGDKCGEYYVCEKCNNYYGQNPPRKETVDIPKPPLKHRKFEPNALLVDDDLPPQEKAVDISERKIKYRELHAAYSKLWESCKKLNRMWLGNRSQESYFNLYLKATQKTEEEKE